MRLRKVFSTERLASDCRCQFLRLRNNPSSIDHFHKRCRQAVDRSHTRTSTVSRKNMSHSRMHNLSRKPVGDNQRSQMPEDSVQSPTLTQSSNAFSNLPWKNDWKGRASTGHSEAQSRRFPCLIDMPTPFQQFGQQLYDFSWTAESINRIDDDDRSQCDHEISDSLALRWGRWLDVDDRSARCAAGRTAIYRRCDHHDGCGEQWITDSRFRRNRPCSDRHWRRDRWRRCELRAS